MPRSFHELRERLLQSGVAPRHVRRYLTELADYLSDLTSEEERNGRSRGDAPAAALARLGSVDDLARSMIEKRQFQSWSSRAPWAIFGIAPLILLGAAYFVACLYLWCGWTMFEPGADTPFGTPVGPIYGVANIYFQAGRLYYFTAPVLVGWAFAFMAARQRLRAKWLAIGLSLVAWMGATAEIQASRTAVPEGFGHIRMEFFTPGPSISAWVVSAIVISTVGVLPYFVWRVRSRHWVCS